jgi:hypothetical protein
MALYLVTQVMELMEGAQDGTCMVFVKAEPHHAFFEKL